MGGQLVTATENFFEHDTFAVGESNSMSTIDDLW
jgi:hypothetical protein